MHTDRLRAVRDTILNNRDSFYYNFFFSSTSEDIFCSRLEESFYNGKEFDSLTNAVRNHCGTSACIAGWTLVMFFRELYPKIASLDIIDWDVFGDNVAEVAQVLLDLKNHEVDFLFYATTPEHIQLVIDKNLERYKNDLDLPQAVFRSAVLSPPAIFRDWLGAKLHGDLQFEEAIARIDHVLSGRAIYEYGVSDSPIYSKVLEFINSRIKDTDEDNS